MYCSIADTWLEDSEICPICRSRCLDKSLDFSKVMEAEALREFQDGDGSDGYVEGGEESFYF